jgi:hypothetical protein
VIGGVGFANIKGLAELIEIAGLLSLDCSTPGFA